MSEDWQVIEGTQAKLEAIEQRVMSERDNFAAALLISAKTPPPTTATAAGTIRCHGCHAEFPFRKTVFLGGGMESDIVRCPCGNQVSMLSCTGSRDNGQFLVVSPFTAGRGQRVATIGIRILSVGTEQEQ